MKNRHVLTYVIRQFRLRQRAAAGMREPRNFDVGNGVDDMHGRADDAPNRLRLALGVGKRIRDAGRDNEDRQTDSAKRFHQRYSGASRISALPLRYFKLEFSTRVCSSFL